jgi:glycosyltransferase involved in cell wall biosynthesis
VPVISWQFAIMTVWQRWQFWQLGRAADHIFFSIAPWVEKYQTWFPDTPVSHLPIGSNIPHSPCSRREARRRVGLPDDALVLGIFGTVSATRMLDAIEAAARAACQAHPNAHLLYVGPHGETVRSLLRGLPLHDAGALPADEVAVNLRAMDVHLAPFEDGVSSRRGSFMAGLANEVASVTTTGEATDSVLATAVDEAFLAAPSTAPTRYVDQVLRLCASSSLRRDIGDAGRRLYATHFGWDVVPKALLRTLEQSTKPNERPVPPSRARSAAS